MADFIFDLFLFVGQEQVLVAITGDQQLSFEADQGFIYHLFQRNLISIDVVNRKSDKIVDRAFDDINIADEKEGFQDMVVKLRQGGLVRADRGRAGGYMLTKIAEQVTLLEALESLGGPIMAEDHCQRYPGIMDSCVHEADCSIRGAFDGFRVYLQKILSATSLADLTSRESETRYAIDQSAEQLIESMTANK